MVSDSFDHTSKLPETAETGTDTANLLGGDGDGISTGLAFVLIAAITAILSYGVYRVAVNYAVNDRIQALSIWKDTTANHMIINMKNQSPNLAELAFAEGVKGIPVEGRAVIFFQHPEKPEEMQEAFLSPTTATWASLNLKRSDDRLQEVKKILDRYRNPNTNHKPISESMVDSFHLETGSVRNLAKATLMERTDKAVVHSDRILVSHFFNRQVKECEACHMHSNAVLIAGENISPVIGRLRLLAAFLVWPVLTILAGGIYRFEKYRRKTQREIENLARFPKDSPSPVLRITSSGKLLYANRASRIVLSGWGCRVGGKVPDEWERRVRETLDMGETGVTEFTSEEHVFEAVLEPITGENYVNLYIRDITQVKRLFTELEKAKNGMEREHREAEEIGKALLGIKPGDGMAHLTRWSLNVEPSSNASGDRAGWLVEKRTSGETRDWLVVFDASGHGLGAAKFQDITLTMLRILLAKGYSMKDALIMVNRNLSELRTDKFLVGNVWRLVPPGEREPEKDHLFIEEFNIAQHSVLELSPEDGDVREWRWMDISGKMLPLGSFDCGYESLKSELRKVKKGSRIITYTDGITEAPNPAREQFGLERLKKLIRETSCLPPEGARVAIVESVKKWVIGVAMDTMVHGMDKVHLNDDITLAIIDLRYD